ncbi:MAG TPA: hypothetical protein VF030_11130, partial [Solirubrobacterales bacterium]
MKRLGPELKKPDLKVPGVLRDLYNDLRDRRLLPLVALVLVAIVAVPFLLSESPEEEPAAVPPLGITPGEAEQASELTVVPATPGLRDYRRRLRARSATNPFKQRYTEPVLKGAKLQSESETSGGEKSSKSKTDTSSSGGIVVDETTGGDQGNGDRGGDNPDQQLPPDTRLFTFAIDVQIAKTETLPDGTVKMGQPERRNGVKPLTPLPGAATPVVTYLGADLEKGRLLLMVSKDVTASF